MLDFANTSHNRRVTAQQAVQYLVKHSYIASLPMQIVGVKVCYLGTTHNRVAEVAQKSAFFGYVDRSS